MDVDHPRTGSDRRFNRLFNGVRDVVIFQVEEDAGVRIDNPADQRRPFTGEETVAYFESAGEPAQRVDQLHRALAAVDIECD